MLNYEHPTHWNFPPACTAPLGASVTNVILKHARQPLLSVLHAAYLFLYRKWLNVLLYIAMFGNVCHIATSIFVRHIATLRCLVHYHFLNLEFVTVYTTFLKRHNSLSWTLFPWRI